MTEHVHCGGIGEVVGRHVDGLHRGDRPALGGGDPLFQGGQHAGQVGLVAEPGGNLSQQC